ncbi:MAG: hypothetical protein B7X35_09940 [Halothiobacillus sp. 14-56-357]|nr:MAG: hypothetical protein B7X35_09940 [Halothiobacillus sp. 14-56-357]
MTQSAMPDVQSSFDPRNIEIDRVGIKAIKHPLTIVDGDHRQATIAECELTVALPADKKGTHMSRFVALLNAEPLVLSLATLPDWTRRMAELLHAQTADVLFAMPFFVEKSAPVSGQKALMEKYITEYAFDHPKFVEDMIRDVAGTLADYPGIDGYRVTVENFESIHNHSAWAVIDRLGA